MEDSGISKPSAFDAPEEAEWHRLISVAAYFIAERHGFSAGSALDDWLQAEQQVKESLST